MLCHVDRLQFRKRRRLRIARGLSHFPIASLFSFEPKLEISALFLDRTLIVSTVRTTLPGRQVQAWGWPRLRHAAVQVVSNKKEEQKRHSCQGEYKRRVRGADLLHNIVVRSAGVVRDSMAGCEAADVQERADSELASVAHLIHRGYREVADCEGDSKDEAKTGKVDEPQAGEANDRRNAGDDEGVDDCMGAG